MLVRENVQDHLDRLFDKIAAAATFYVRVPDAIEDCLRAAAEARMLQPTFAELGRIVGVRVREREAVQRKNAWTFAHALNGRIHCVGNYVVFRRRQRKGRSLRYVFESPVVDQLRLLDVATREANLETLAAKIEGSGALKRIGGICVDAPNGVVYLLQAISYSQARRLRPGITESRASIERTLPLFGQFDDRPVSGAAFSSAAILTLRIAADFLAKICPGFRIVPLAMIAADPGAGWEYQIHDVSDATDQSTLGRLTELDEFRLYDSSVRRRNGAKALILDQLPQSLASREMLHAAPVDRATRAYMALSVLWDKQRNEPGHLASMSRGELAKAVCRRYSIAYSRDLRRHDFEDCLQKHGYIDEPLYRPGEYAITHRGVGRLCFFLASTSGNVPDALGANLGENIISHIMQQAARWDEYCFGEARKR